MPPSEITIFERIEFGLARQVRDTLARAGKGPVVVRIHSPGGAAPEALAVYSLLRAHTGGVTTIVEGTAASGASAIAMAGQDVQIAESGFLMLHDAYASVDGTADEMANMAATLRTLSEQFVNIYVGKSKQPADKIRQLMAEETWLSATEARQLGLVDRIIPARRVAASWQPEKFFRNPPPILNSGKVLPVSATLQELKAALPGADPAFLVAQLEAAATIDQARASFLDQREKQLAAREAELNAKAGKKPGVAPLAASIPVGSAGGAGEDFGELLAEAIAKGEPRFKAVARLGRKHPEAHRAFVESNNPSTAAVQALVAQRFGS